MNDAVLRHIDEKRLDQDLGYRFSYLAEFMGFGADDIERIHAAAAHLAPLVPQLVDAVYVKLFQYDATKRHFVPRQAGYEGPVPSDIKSLSLDHEQIKFRKSHLANYLKKLVTANYDDKLVTYLDFVGKIHTPLAGSKELDVPLVQMNALMGFVADALLGAILGLPLEAAERAATVRAFNKLLWLQNDLIARHYLTKRGVTVLLPRALQLNSPATAARRRLPWGSPPALSSPPADAKAPA